MNRIMATLLLVLAGTAPAPAQQADDAVHDELRAMLQGMQQAINDRQWTDLEPYFHENLRVTTINQEIISERSEISDYFEGWFGDGGFLATLEITLTADALTELYGDRSFGIVRGDGLEKYVLADGRPFDMTTRWTATVVRDTDGSWRILALHIGTDFLDNPVLGAAESGVRTAGMVGALGGLVLGCLATFVLMRRRKAQA